MHKSIETFKRSICVDNKEKKENPFYSVITQKDHIGESLRCIWHTHKDTFKQEIEVIDKQIARLEEILKNPTQKSVSPQTAEIKEEDITENDQEIILDISIRKEIEEKEKLLEKVKEENRYHCISWLLIEKKWGKIACQEEFKRKIEAFNQLDASICTGERLPVIENKNFLLTEKEKLLSQHIFLKKESEQGIGNKKESIESITDSLQRAIDQEISFKPDVLDPLNSLFPCRPFF